MVTLVLKGSIKFFLSSFRHIGISGNYSLKRIVEAVSLLSKYFSVTREFGISQFQRASYSIPPKAGQQSNFEKPHAMREKSNDLMVRGSLLKGPSFQNHWLVS